MQSVIGSQTGVYVGCFTKDFESLGGRDPCKSFQSNSPLLLTFILQLVGPSTQRQEMVNPCCQIECLGLWILKVQVLPLIRLVRPVYMPSTWHVSPSELAKRKWYIVQDVE